MSLAAATTKLGALVYGIVVGIAVTSHGLSPRILTARVVGTRGSTSVTGTQLQGAFGLATTDAAFTTISTTAAHGALTGSVYPTGAAGRSVTVQRLSAGGWTTIGHAPLAAGVFTWPAPIARRYRITDRSLGGPAVNER